MSQTATQTVTVAYATMDQTAVAGLDYTDSSGTVTFKARERTKTILVPTLQDDMAEATETFTVRLSAPSGATLADGTGTASITDDDDRPDLTIDDAAALTEGDTATFGVTLSGESGLPVTVEYVTSDGTAVAGSDYTQTSGTLRFEPGEMTKTIPVQTLQDDMAEATETFTVRLSAPSGATLADQTGTASITDDDDRPDLTIDDAAALTEGDTATFGVTLSGESGLPVTVEYVTSDGTAVAGSDYTQTSGTLRFEPGEMTKTIPVQTLQDDMAEATETFTVRLSAPSGATLAGRIGTALITDDDESPELGIDDAPAVNEGDTATFEVTLSGESGLPVTVEYVTSDGTAVAGLDYTQTSGTLRFEPGEMTMTIPVQTLQDELAEATETFTVRLSAPTGATVANGTGTASIIDDDEPPELTIDDAPVVSEGETAEFTVRLGAVSGLAVSASYRTVDVTAVAGFDYTSGEGTLRFEPGEMTKTIPVQTLQDELAEATETFTVRLSTPSGATLADGTGMASITDDDDPPQLIIDNAPAVTEGQPAEFTVRLDAESGLPVSVSYRTSDVTAVADSDYRQTSGTLGFEPGETAKTVRVRTLPDDTAEATEAFTVELHAPTGATVANGTGTASIIDDDEPPELTIGDAPVVSEGETAEFTVRLGAVSGLAVSASYRTVDVTAQAGFDYTQISGTLRFEPGDTIRTIGVPVLPDDLLEGDERFSVELSDVSGATVADGAGVGTITDDAERRIGLINQVVLPEIGRALAFTAVNCRIDQAFSDPGGPRNAGDSVARLSLSPALISARPGAPGAQPLTVEQALDDSLLLISSQDEGDGGGGFAAWGCADYRNLGGGNDGPVAWDGSVFSSHVGADARLGANVLVGLSVSLSNVSFNYDAGAEAGGGTYELQSTGLHPYLAWSVTPDLDVWGTFGHGWGELGIADDFAVGLRTSPATLDSGVVGVSGRVLARGATSLRLKGEWALARMDVAGSRSTFEAMAVNVRRLRLRTEASHQYEFSFGQSLTPWGEFGLRHDGGDGATGAGLEMGGGLRYHHAGVGLTAESQGRWLALHKGATREWGLGGRLRFDPGASGRGPSVSLAPAWGQTASGVQRLWERGPDNPTLPDVRGMRLDARFGYGFGTFRGRGVLTPYADVSLAGQARRGYRMGGLLAVGSSATVSMEAERREYVAATIFHAFRVRGALQF